MGARTLLEAKKDTAQAAAPARPRRSQHADGGPALGALAPGYGHDFGSVRPGPAMETCPLAGPRRCPFGGACHTCPVQVQRAADHSNRARTAGRLEAAVPEGVVAKALRGSGRLLDPDTREWMESRFGQDFGNVEIHTGAEAAASARALGARAYSFGRHIVFGPGQYKPETPAGKRLLAHELVHVVQQQPRIARDLETIPAPTFEETLGPSLERARRYNPPLPRHEPLAPPIPEPPIPEEAAPPATCPPAAKARREIRSSDVAGATEARMTATIGESSLRAERGVFRASPAMVRAADSAIRRAFGNWLPANRRLLSRGTVSIRSPEEFAELRVPGEDAARESIGRAALKAAPGLLRSLCIMAPNHQILSSEVEAPILSRRGIEFVREYESARIGGQTSYTGGRVAGTKRHVDLPRESSHMGHVVVHEAVHYYVHDTYLKTASGHPLEQQLLEGGAEFLARHVIQQYLEHRPEFRINYGTYSSELAYVREHLLGGGLSTFALAYFQGHVDLLGLAPRGVRPKLEVSAPDDEFEREADRIAERVSAEPAGVTTLPLSNLPMMATPLVVARQAYRDCTPATTGTTGVRTQAELDTLIGNALSSGRSMATAARTAATRIRAGAGSDRERAALTAHFGNLTNPQQDTVITRYGTVPARLGNPQRVICNTAASWMCRTGRTCAYAFCPAPAQPTHICPPFFGVRPCDMTREQILIEEAVHAAGACSDVRRGAQGYPPANAQNNGPSYAWFADAVTSARPTLEPPTPERPRFPSLIEDIIKHQEKRMRERIEQSVPD